MSIRVITPPAGEPVSLAEAKLHLRVDTNDEDTLISSLITAARQYCEAFQRRAYITQTLELSLDSFPSGSIELPNPPLQSVEIVSYLDAAGVQETLAPTAYAVDTSSEPGRILPVAGWPRGKDVRIRYTAGYGPDGTAVPATVRQSICLLVGWWYSQREAAVVGQTVTKVPLAVESLLWLGRVGA